ncbi:MAG: hypothetical protein JWQ66_2370 [Mucilaginibacter sp.]|nr:hypothetical protein [Mucilaginibacter sp.]
MKLYSLFKFLPVFLFLFVTRGGAKNIETKVALINESLVLDKPIDLHLTNAIAPMKNSTVDLTSEEAWLFFDNMIPSTVLEKYSRSILINGKPFQAGVGGNGRIAIYKQGAVIIAQPDGYQPLEAFTERNFGGTGVKYALYSYYTNKLTADMPAGLILPLVQDNSIRSFKLKRGYMATFANEPDGMGYSRVFVADTADITIPGLPAELDQKASYVRVFRWQWPSKKGWCGGRGSVVASNGVNEQDNEVKLTQSTWFYSWGTSDPTSFDSEFVPMKWGYGGSMAAINSRTDVTHLLGYNEPNRPDQSKMSVDNALEEWPRLMKSGLRLGSPSVSDNSRLDDWLYRFIDECDKRNYRVDYIAVHAYWGAEQMPSAEDWYKKLKEIHLKTGRPIWLTEWNNGANWTKEAWPQGKAEQQAKQLRELRKIIQVLDTASFVERYSIYNWVEDKRAIVLDSIGFKTVDGKSVKDKLLSQELTPAGSFYRDNTPGFAFNVKNQVIPKWNFSEGPVLSYTLSKSNEIRLEWVMKNSSEMVNRFTIERSTDNRMFKEIGTVSRPAQQVYTEPLIGISKNPAGAVYYRIRAIDPSGKAELLSNAVSYSYLKNQKNLIAAGNLIATADWSLFAFVNTYDTEPVVITGTATNRNKAPQAVRIQHLGKTSFEFRFDPWEYLKNPVFINKDTIAYIGFPGAGTYNLKGVTALAGKATSITHDWAKVQFSAPFKQMPVVFASQITSHCDSAAAVRIRNVTTKGFELQLQYESAVTPPSVSEDVAYLAVTPGKGLINGKKIQIGRTEELSVGDYFGSGKIEFADPYIKPAFFGAMQTESDGFTSALRIKSRGINYTEVFREGEMSKGGKALSRETVGWMVLETAGSPPTNKKVKN